MSHKAKTIISSRENAMIIIVSSCKAKSRFEGFKINTENHYINKSGKCVSFFTHLRSNLTYFFEISNTIRAVMCNKTHSEKQQNENILLKSIKRNAKYLTTIKDFCSILFVVFEVHFRIFT